MDVTLEPRVHEDLSSRFIPPYSTISFRHPAYADFDDVLLKLPRLDRNGLATGVHHRTALQACQIIANNAFHGYLATDRDGQQAVTVAPDGILTEDSYWLIVERRDGDGDGDVEQRQGRYVYPIVPTFEDWRFPHDDFLNLGWGDGDADTTAPPNADRPYADRPDADAAAPPDDATAPPHPPPVLPIAAFAVPRPNFSRCVLSNYDYSITRAHIVPSANITWFQVNNMKRYEDEQHTMRFIHNTRNKITIRADLHNMWDAHMFAFVPKRGGQYIAHVLTAPTPGSREFAAKWHNRLIQRNAFECVAKQYIFAKFAQAVFMLLKPFIAFSPTEKYVARLRAGNRHEVQREWLSETALRDLYSGGGSRKASESPSSRKRSRSQTSANDEEEDDSGWEWPPQKTRRVRVYPWGGVDAEHCDCSDSEEEERGRRRKRRQGHVRSEHTVDTLPSLTDTSVVDTEENLNDSWQCCIDTL
ncbi:hypothetical protein F5883DRAFT_591009 [Diaporthe sp. PMI_573]|nr:hypothetical protein F5883DRAFT_591009 [Diaporthaceae sp. PMI_573]